MPSFAVMWSSDLDCNEAAVGGRPGTAGTEGRRWTAGRGWIAVLALGIAFAAAPPVGGNEAGKVAVLFNANAPRSRDVAEFYARQRGVPEAQVIGLECGSDTLISRQAFDAEIVAPLRRILAERGLAQFDSGQPSRMTGTKIRYLVTVYGMPYRILHDPQLVEEGAASLPDTLKNNGAAVDADLMLLPAPVALTLAGPIQNPHYASTNAAAIRPEAGLFLVSRLDGPTPELAMGLVTQAMEADRDGLWGRAYLDLRGLKDGSYKLGDEWLASAEATCRLLGFETEVDRNEATFPVGFPMSDIGIYAGWYDANVSGPFTLPTVDFRTGAIAYHIHSYSAFDPRSPSQNWVGPLVAKGATVTLGCVDEPYLQMTPNFGAFLSRLALGMNFAEAGLVGQPVLSWQTVLIGDPLYRPFSPDLYARSQELERTGSPLLSWSILHRVNFFLQNGGDVGRALGDLETLSNAATNVVLASKVARLYADRSRLRQSVTWGRRALDAGGTPAERARLYLEIADWQRILDQSADAYATLQAFVKEFPGHPDLLAVRRQQLGYARDLDRKDDIPFLKAEVDRLTPPKPPGN